MYGWLVGLNKEWNWIFDLQYPVWIIAVRITCMANYSYTVLLNTVSWTTIVIRLLMKAVTRLHA